jgi:pyruvate kinase
MSVGDRIASLVRHALETVPCDAVLAPTRSGTTARVISRCKPPVWIVAPSDNPAVCQGLAFSYGVDPVDLEQEPDDWAGFAVHWLREHRVRAERVMLVAGPSPHNPDARHRLEFLRLDGTPARIE